MTETAQTQLDFWYDLASTYSYVAAMRIEARAAEANARLRWRPFLLGPIFAEQGWTTSPFNLFPAKGKYMWRDMERLCLDQELPFRKPDPFPQNSLLAARVALVAEAQGFIAEFTKAVFVAEFAAGAQISDPDVLKEILRDFGHDPEAIMAVAVSDDNKARLKAETEEAKRLGIFGAPSFVTKEGELFWGNDRLEQALDWA